MRAVAQMLSYEICMLLILMPIFLLTSSLDLVTIVEFQKGCWNIIGLYPSAFLFYLCLLAETNRAPFVRHNSQYITFKEVLRLSSKLSGYVGQALVNVPGFEGPMKCPFPFKLVGLAKSTIL